MGGIVLGILVWQEGGAYVGLIIAIGVVALAAFAYWLVQRKRSGKPTLLDPDLFKHLNFRIGISQQMLQQITLGGAMIALPLFLQMTLEYNAMQAGLSLAPLSLSMFGMALLAGRKAGKRRPANIVLAGFSLCTIGIAAIIPLVPRVDSGWYLVIPLLIAGSGLGLLVSQLNNFTLAPITEERVSEAAGVNSAAGSFGLSFGLAVAGGLMLWILALSFTHLTYSSTAIPPAQQQTIAAEMETNAEIMSNTQLQQEISSQPPKVQNAVLDINTEARDPLPPVRAPRPRHRRASWHCQLVSDATTARHQARRTSRWRRFRLGEPQPPTWLSCAQCGCPTSICPRVTSARCRLHPFPGGNVREEGHPVICSRGIITQTGGIEGGARPIGVQVNGVEAAGAHLDGSLHAHVAIPREATLSQVPGQVRRGDELGGVGVVGPMGRTTLCGSGYGVEETVERRDAVESVLRRSTRALVGARQESRGSGAGSPEIDPGPVRTRLARHLRQCARVVGEEGGQRIAPCPIDAPR